MCSEMGTRTCASGELPLTDSNGEEAYLSGHVSALLRSRSLVLNVDTSGTSLDHHFGESHDSGETWGSADEWMFLDSDRLTSVTSVGVGDHGAEVVDGRGELFSLGQGLGAGPSLFTVVEELSGEQLGDLVGDSVGGVVWGLSVSITTQVERKKVKRCGKKSLTSQIRTRFEGAGSGRAALPSRDVDGLEVLGHLGDLDGVQTAGA